MSDILHRMLAERPWLLADGATGTNFFAAGLPVGHAPELWNIDEPDKVRDQYRSFIEAGSDIILTNTFGGTRNRLKLHGADERVAELSEAGGSIARSRRTSARSSESSASASRGRHPARPLERRRLDVRCATSIVRHPRPHA